MEQKPSFDKRFALLIDADNVSSKYIKPILDELSKYGTITYKRIYGDWTSTLHAKWKDALLDNSITPIQQFSYTVGKNATDSAMIIDAMDILYTNSVEGFCLVSSDSDFTRLASRIRESGLTVIGMGEKKTPTPFRKACDIFTTLELLIGEARRDKANGSSSSLTIEEVERAVVDIITDNQNNGKSTGLGEVGSRLLKRYPDFDVRSFGTNLLSKLLGEFKSVTIRKDGSNVRVELAEGVEHERAAAERPSDSEGVGEQAGEQAETACASEDSESEGGEDASSHSSKSRRRSRRRRKSSKVSGVEQGESADTKADETIDGQREATSETAESQTVSADQRGESSDSPAGEQEVTSDETGASQAEEAEAQVAAADEANRAAKAQAQTASDSAEGGKAQVPAKRRRSRSRKAPAAPTAPDDFIRAEVAASGKSGMAVAELAKRVRTRFKSFKVRELGYPHLAGYLADVEGVRVYKQGRENWVAKE
ncbi:NYN domain-containing protein [Ellagibacter isourolithinifaciens]|uniref:NYN domain-containing protein n=1 Tax=Ellagibacter isourolithinifaciens TaxID=2137581 RepID=UPI0023F5340B|nr:NYN domain-containing protein [Ellagibacter isourolithinifaciens]MDD5926370.1 NYN domain-containing protein [Ellagibacter isourolithinifaciens]MDY4988057.1 NYN domain-containing protein [Ellagibacter isourolithinifaciens]